MTGLEKIIACIMEEAHERARTVLQEAEESCRRMASDCATSCESVRARAKEITISEGEALIERTRLALEQQREEKLRAVRESALDRVFEAARAELHSNEYGKYREFLTAWLVSALLEQNAAQEDGEPVLEVLLSKRDRADFGRAVIDGARRVTERRIGKEKAARLQLSDDVAEIDGGVILRCGEQVFDYSLDAQLAAMRAELAPQLLAILFDA